MPEMNFKGSERLPWPSPGPSSPSTVEGIIISPLPTPRHHPLKPASQKEIAFINYLDSQILQISRRYAKKFSSDRSEADEEARGYNDFAEVADEVEHVLNAIWVSSTRKQIVPRKLKLLSHSYLLRMPYRHWNILSVSSSQLIIL